VKSIGISSIVWVVMLSAAWAQKLLPPLYTIDTQRSKIELTVFRSGFLKMIGHDHTIAARSFYGQVRFNPENIGDSSVQLSIDSESLIVLEDPGVSEKDRKSIQADMEGNQVLDIRQFPTITFRSTEVSRSAKSGEELTIRGKLSLHGTEKEISFPVQIHPGAHLLQVSGSAVIDQRDFGIKPIKIAAGTLRVKDELKVRFDIVAKRAD
jgi:polyisoprenoid-binding protein YceI